jgi:hypothetical protein
MGAFLVEGFAEDGRSDRQNILPTPFLSEHHIFCHFFPPSLPLSHLLSKDILKSVPKVILCEE